MYLKWRVNICCKNCASCVCVSLCKGLEFHSNLDKNNFYLAVYSRLCNEKNDLERFKVKVNCMSLDAQSLSLIFFCLL